MLMLMTIPMDTMKIMIRGLLHNLLLDVASVKEEMTPMSALEL